MKYLDVTNGERQTPVIPQSIRELMNGGLDMKLHTVQHHAQMAYLLSGELLNEELSDEGRAQPSDLCRMTSSGSEELLFALPGVAPEKISVSNDGSKLAVNSAPEIGADPDMYIVDLSTGTNNRLTRGGQADISAWGGDDNMIAPRSEK